jgi:hypothetical protein
MPSYSESTAATEHRPPINSGGTTFALLAPRSLRPSGHLRWASSSHPNSPVVSSVTRGAAASILRNQISDLRYQSSVLDREAASQSSAAERPLPSLLHLKAGSVGSVHYSEPRLTLDFESPQRRPVNP